MTISNQTSRVTAAGNDVATVFSFSPMVIYSADELLVVVATSAGVETVIARGATSTTYSHNVTTYPNTGSITYPAVGGTPLPTGSTITIKRVLVLEQPTDLNSQGPYLAETQETQFDKLVAIALQQQESISRALRMKVSYTGSAAIETIPAPVAGQYLRYNAAGTALEWSDAAGPAGPTGPAGADGSVTGVTATAPIASSGGAAPVISLNNDGVTYAKIQNVSATDRLLGRSTAGAGDIEEIVCTAAGRAILDDVDAAAQRTTLGIGALSSWDQNGFGVARYYSQPNASASANAGIIANTLLAVLFVASKTKTFDRIGINVATAVAGNIRLGLYNMANGYPTTLLLDAGTVSTATTGVKEIVISQNLNAGLYALAMVADATPTLSGGTNHIGISSMLFGAPGGSNDPTMAYTYVFTYAALPANYAAGASGSSVFPRIFLRST